MQFWKNSKGLISLILIAGSALTLVACDKLAPAARKVEQIGKSEYYGFRADKWSEIEDAYLGAQSYCCGPDTMKDDVRALELYCKAAQYGHKASMIEIARMYIHEGVAGVGTAIPYDQVLSYAYFTKAGEGGYAYGAAMRDSLGRKLTPEELEKAKQLVAEYPNIPCALTR
jgi:TPR repeat protein